ncbi:hypothetical protein [Humibacter ginsenosidimutans]|uniref:SRPBCC family protein n=1 Tax=Humibacter ginsenosidimutans TaxID=2599293 RepID=A0A5B8M5N7_9MICO|nr:hypothetical protein [Humibacter ginsenosidimutans]QDZ15264.1 hypothetical protein FPZ11_11280 [Humibacter ginsenosidimutans]
MSEDDHGALLQSFQGHVQADESRVWEALLTVSPFVTEGMRRRSAEGAGRLGFPARPPEADSDTSPVPGVNVEIDTVRHALVISGQWWFRGVYETTAEDSGARLRYRSYNVAGRGSRWLVPLVAGSALRADGRAQFEDTLQAVGRALSSAVRFEGE